MYIDTEGIILRQVKTVNGRRILSMFTKKYGKIGAGSGLTEKGRGKAALAMRPFTFGRYELYKNNDNFNIKGMEVIQSFYKIGEDVDKYMCASYILEFTDKLLLEGKPEPKLFDILIEFFTVLADRQKDYATVAIAYEIKALALMGAIPELHSCVICGNREAAGGFSVKDGGVICRQCRNNMEPVTNVSLIYDVNFGIINIIDFFLKNPIKSLEKIGLEEKVKKELQTILKSYSEYHLDISGLKSENFLV